MTKCQQLGGDPSDHGAKLESMPRKASDHQNAFKRRMPIEDEVVIRRVVVNAHSSVANARIGKRGNDFAEECSTTINERLFDFIRQRIRIDWRAFQMISDLHC